MMTFQHLAGAQIKFIQEIYFSFHVNAQQAYLAFAESDNEQNVFLVVAQYSFITWNILLLLLFLSVSAQQFKSLLPSALFCPAKQLSQFPIFRGPR